MRCRTEPDNATMMPTLTAGTLKTMMGEGSDLAPFLCKKRRDHLLVKLSGGRIVEATIKAVVETTEGVRLQVSFGDETVQIYLWQIVKELRWLET
jgi:hypothetical protein